MAVAAATMAVHMAEADSAVADAEAVVVGVVVAAAVGRVVAMVE